MIDFGIKRRKAWFVGLLPPCEFRNLSDPCDRQEDRDKVLREVRRRLRDSVLGIWAIVEDKATSSANAGSSSHC